MKSNNINIFKNTMSIFAEGYYVKNEKMISLKLSKQEQYESNVLLPEDVKAICEKKLKGLKLLEGRTDHFCVNDDSYSVAMDIKRKHSDGKVCVLNFANPIYPGGGVRYGDNAQEEDLCRKSSLLLSLETPESSKYYAYNEALDSDLGSDAIIISPKVEIIKDANGDLLDESVVASVLTCAAPILIYGFELSSQEEYEELLYKRIMGILKVSATYDYRYLVLGAWGCGAFGNNAEVVARLFYKALLEIEYDDSTKESMFAEIHFAVLDKSPDKYNFNSFNKYFNGNNFYMEEMLDASAD